MQKKEKNTKLIKRFAVTNNLVFGYTKIVGCVLNIPFILFEYQQVTLIKIVKLLFTFLIGVIMGPAFINST